MAARNDGPLSDDERRRRGRAAEGYGVMDTLPEHWQAIWRAAETVPSNSTDWKSGFNDGAHWQIRQVQGTIAPLKELLAVDEAVDGWTDGED